VGSRGVTLFELMVTLGILSILAAIAWPNYQRWQAREGLDQAVMYVQSAISAARSRSAAEGWTCATGTAPNSSTSCDTLYFGAELNPAADPATVSLVYFCDSNEEVCGHAGAATAVDTDEVKTLWTRQLNRQVTVDAGGTTLTDNRIWFDKFGVVYGDAGTVRLTAADWQREVVVGNSGRIQTE
jgi:prepilin-type N-terminal cleavage/methylation domain-containing protein